MASRCANWLPRAIWHSRVTSLVVCSPNAPSAENMGITFFYNILLSLVIWLMVWKVFQKCGGRIIVKASFWNVVFCSADNFIRRLASVFFKILPRRFLKIDLSPPTIFLPTFPTRMETHHNPPVENHLCRSNHEDESRCAGGLLTTRACCSDPAPSGTT